MRLLDTITVSLLALVVIGMILRLGHCSDQRVLKVLLVTAGDELASIG